MLIEEILSKIHRSGARYFLPEALYLKASDRLTLSGLPGSPGDSRKFRIPECAWGILASSARLVYRRSDVAKTRALTEQARQVVHFIAEHIPEQDLRESFNPMSAEILELTQERR